MLPRTQPNLAIALGVLFTLQNAALAFDRVDRNLIEAEPGDTRIDLIGDSTSIIGIDYGADGTIDDTHSIFDGELEIDCTRAVGVRIRVLGQIATGREQLDLFFLNHENAQIFSTIDGEIKLTLVGDGETRISGLRALNADISVADGQILGVSGAAIRYHLHVSWFIWDRMASQVPLSHVTLNEVVCESLTADHQYGQSNESLTMTESDVQEALMVESRHPLKLDLRDSSCDSFAVTDRSFSGMWDIRLGLTVMNFTGINLNQAQSLISIYDNAEFGRSTIINTGEGSTTLVSLGDFNGNLEIECGNSRDTIILGDSKGAKSLIDGSLQITNAGDRTLNTEREREWIDISNVEVSDAFRIETGDSVDGIRLNDLFVASTSEITTGNADDRVELLNSTFVGDVDVNGDSGRSDRGDEEGCLFLGSVKSKEFERGNLR